METGREIGRVAEIGRVVEMNLVDQREIDVEIDIRESHMHRSGSRNGVVIVGLVC